MTTHHPTLDNLRAEHGLAEWSDWEIRRVYKDHVLTANDGTFDSTFDWRGIHDRDHADPAFQHRSELVELLGEV